MIRETRHPSQESSEPTILPLPALRHGTDRGLDPAEPRDESLRTDNEPPSTPDDFPGWDTMIMALMA